MCLMVSVFLMDTSTLRTSLRGINQRFLDAKALISIVFSGKKEIKRDCNNLRQTEGEKCLKKLFSFVYKKPACKETGSYLMCCAIYYNGKIHFFLRHNNIQNLLTYPQAKPHPC